MAQSLGGLDLSLGDLKIKSLFLLNKENKIDRQV